MSNPDYILPELVEKLPQWQLVADCYLGQDAIKAKGEIYLPNPSPINEDEDVRQKRYEDYQKRAVYHNATRRTAKIMAGLVFAKYPTLNLPTALQELSKNIDGGKKTLVQQARQALIMLMLKGRGGLLADFSTNIGNTTKAQMRQLGLRPTIKLYEPENIINWRVENINNQAKLILVVIRESFVKKDDGFRAEYGEQLLVLRLENGIATSEIYQKNGSWQSVTKSVITDNNGVPFDTLPFTFFGADDNDETIDDAPLYDLAVLNLAHYRNSADYEEGNFIAGQPTLFITGLTEGWYQDVIKDGNPIRLGSRSANLLGSGSNAFLLQANANSGLREAMTDKKEQMIALGAKLIEPSNVNKTATQAQSDNASESSILSTLANNLSDAYSLALNFCAKFAGVEQNCVFTLNTRFMTNKMTADERRQLISEWQAGAISFAEMRAKLIEDEIASVEDVDEIRATIESELQGYDLNEKLNQS